MSVHQVGIVMNGVTGRMGANQHLLRSIRAIIDQGGVQAGGNEVIMPVPVLVGRDRGRLEALASRAGGLRFTGQYAPVGNPSCIVFLDHKKHS